MRSEVGGARVEGASVPLELRYERFSSFYGELAAHLTRDEVFLPGVEGVPADRPVALRISVGVWSVLRARCRLVEEPSTRDHGGGTRLRFSRIEPQSERLLRWVVEQHAWESGRRPAESVSVPELVAGADADTSELEVWARSRRERRRWILASASAALAAVALTLVIVVRGRDGVGPSTNAVGESDATVEVSTAAEGGAEESRGLGGRPVADPSSAHAGAAGGLSARPSSGTPGSASRRSPPPEVALAAPGVEEAVLGWAEAWSRQDPGTYLSFYARAFRPAGGLGREEWERQREERLLSPAFIEVEVADLRISGARDRRRAVFEQRYRSPGFSDRVRKVLELELEDGAWRIVSERAESNG